MSSYKKSDIKWNDITLSREGKCSWNAAELINEIKGKNPDFFNNDTGSCDLSNKEIEIRYQILECSLKNGNTGYLRIITFPFYRESQLTKGCSEKDKCDKWMRDFFTSTVVSKYKEIAVRNKTNKSFYDNLYKNLHIDRFSDKKQALNMLYHHDSREKFLSQAIGNIWQNLPNKKFKISDLKESDYDDFLSFRNFLNIIAIDPRCGYCGITIDQILTLSKQKLYTKRARGYIMEIDQKEPSNGYTDENCISCCYWCNNAKSDEFDALEFEKIAKGIKEVWMGRDKSIKKMMFRKTHIQKGTCEKD